MRIAVTLCTRQRPEQLDAALKALSQVEVPVLAEVFAVIVENDSAESAKAIIDRHKSGIPMHYFLETNPGLSPARNRGIEEALKLGAEWIATCDDDCVMQPDCIAAYVRAIDQFPHTQVFIGRTRYIFPESMPKWYPRPSAKAIETGRKPLVLSTSNSLFSRAVVDENGHNLRFDDAFRFSGGEDVDFFVRARTATGPVVWVEEAIVVEAVLESRTRLNFLFRRQLRNGQNLARILLIRQSGPMAFLKIVHAVYRFAIVGVFTAAAGMFEMAVDKERGRTRLFAGLIHLTSAAGMLRAYFASPTEWYKNIDGG